MKIFVGTLLLFLVLSSCVENRLEHQSSHPSFVEIQNFVEKEKGTRDLKIQQIEVTNFHLKEYKVFSDDKPGPEGQSYHAYYNLTLKGKNKSYNSKAVLISDNNSLWEMDTLTVMEEADSAGKHFEKIMRWNRGDSVSNYEVTLKITH